jgi:hypothetical protein
MKRYSCPMIEWQILRSHAELAHIKGDSVVFGEYRARALDVIHSLADSLDDSALRSKFLGSKTVRDL